MENSLPERMARKNYSPYKEAQEFARSKNFRNIQEWKLFCKSPDFPSDIRKNPQDYPEFTNWRDWLGTENKSNKEKKESLDSYEIASEKCKKLGLKSITEFKSARKKGLLPGVPSNPNRQYKDFEERGGYQSFLGYTYDKKEYSDYETCKNYIQHLGLKSQKEFDENKENGKIPKWIPKSPQVVFANEGWISWPNFLGTSLDTIMKRDYLSYEESSNFFVNLGIDSYGKLRIFLKNNTIPLNVPKKPHLVYKEIWDKIGGYGGFFKTGNISSISINKERIKILREILDQDLLVDLPPVILLLIIGQNNLDKVIRSRSTVTLNSLLATKPGSEERQSLDEMIREGLSNTNDEDLLNISENDDDQEEIGDLNTLDDQENQEEEIVLPERRFQKDLQVLRKLDKITISKDSEVIDFIIKFYLDKIWRAFMEGCDMEPIKELGNSSITKSIKERFEMEYNEVLNLKETSVLPGYRFHSKPNWMQWIVSHRLMRDKNHINLSEPGAGKTLASVLSSVLVNSELTLFVCPNSRLSETISDIHSYFSDCTVYTLKTLSELDSSLYRKLDKDNPTIQKRSRTFFVVNVEAFQVIGCEGFWADFSARNKVDFICLDEVHDVKQSQDEFESKRKQNVETLVSEQRKKATEDNRDFYLMPMSGTAVVNNLLECKKLIELTTGEDYSDLSTAPAIKNALTFHQILNTIGTRFKPSIPHKLDEEQLYIDGTDLISELRTVGKGEVLRMEQILLDKKLEAILPLLKKGEKYLFYTHFVDGILDKIGSFLTKNGFTSDFYTGEYKLGKNRFINGEVDVLIGSSSISIGIDGLQRICNNLFILAPPWTNAAYNQLVRRLYRQGSLFKTVYVKEILVQIPLEENIWSYDEGRYKIIDYKRTLSDCVLDGEIPRGKIPSPEVLLERSRKSLEEWLSRLEAGKEILGKREKIEREFYSSLPEQTKCGQFNENKFRDFNRDWTAKYSNNLHEELKADPSKWHEYHSLYREKRKSWEETPYEYIASYILKRPDWIVGDFGCGDNLMKKYLNNEKIFSFDHIAIDESVIECDMAKVPLGDDFLDVAVYSLSLMGRNFLDYLVEAKRVLKPYGKIFIAEPINSQKWGEDIFEGIKQKLQELGFGSISKLKSNDKFIYIQAEKS